jgi:hypothetical protein
MSVTNTKCPITMLKTSKNENFKKIGPLKKHGHIGLFLLFLLS